jgi:23S rRNA (cytidine2498-2'-O)-methyltransferase
MSFIFVICQNGAEVALKDEFARRYPHFRFAYSRPGFVTFKVPESLRKDRQFQLKSVFARTWGFSLGKVKGADGHQLARELWQSLVERFPQETLREFQDLHVYQRDQYLPGEGDFEPGPTPLTDEIGQLIKQSAADVDPENVLRLNETTAPDVRVLDCVVLEPGEWWFGWHRANETSSVWPGGVPFVDMPDEFVSRTYLKMAEAFVWSELPFDIGDPIVEIGSSPGGASQMLLRQGFSVTGIDPAEMDPVVLGHPYFVHIKARAKDLKRRVFSNFRWLVADASVAPTYTLDTIEAIVTHPSVSIEGLILTLKLSNWTIANQIPEFHKRIRSWGYPFVRSRQLAFNRREICVVAGGEIVDAE